MTTTLSRGSASLQSDRRRSRQQKATPSATSSKRSGPAPVHKSTDRRHSTSGNVVVLRSAKPAKTHTRHQSTATATQNQNQTQKQAQTQLRNKTNAKHRWLAPLGLLCAAVSLVLGWEYRGITPLSAEHGLGYALGIVSVTCMSTLLIYPLRKRWRWLRFIGSVKNWFKTHMTLGVLTPIAGLFHCNFQLGSLNSQIALYCMLVVAASGLVGRLLYQKMHQSLYGQKTDFRQLRIALQNSKPKPNKALPFLPLISQRLARFDEVIFAAAPRLLPALKLAPGLGFKARKEKRALLNFADVQLRKTCHRRPELSKHRERILGTLEHYLNQHMQKACRLGRAQAYERLFALWHLVHLPFFIIMLLSVAVHVAAVHLY